ncbi:MAG: hypothetical protein ACOX8W_07690 [bacterium]
MALSYIVPVILLAIVVMIIAGARGETNKGGEDVIKNVYIYLVLFATLMMTIGGSVGTFMAIADIVAPTPYYQSFEDYKRFSIERPATETENEAAAPLSEEEMRAKYDAMVQEQKDLQVARAKNSLIKSLGWIIVPLAVFLYYQKRLPRKETPV